MGGVVYAPDQIESRAICNDGIFRIHILSYTRFTCQLLVRVGVKMTKSQHYFGPWPGGAVAPDYCDEAPVCVFSVNVELRPALNHDADILRYPSYQLRPDLPPYWVSPCHQSDFYRHY